MKFFEKIRIHPLFWLILGISLITAQMKQVSVIFLLVFLHELGHALVASYYKWKIKKIELLPFGGVMETDEFGSRSLKEENLVVLGGPLVHVVLLLGYFVGDMWFSFDSEWANLFVKANISLLVFNLLPIYPLDGGRLFLNLLSIPFPFIRSLRVALIFSVINLVIFFIIVMMVSPLNLPFWMVSLFLSVTLFYEWRNKAVTFMRFLLLQYYGSNQKLHSLKKIYVEKNDYVYSVFTKFYRGCKHVVVVKDDVENSLSYDENELYYSFFSKKNTSARISDLYLE